MNRHEYFQKRLHDLGLFDKESYYDGMIGKAIEKMSALFAEEGHSGVSAEITLTIFNKLMDEWTKGEIK